jgi:hypothetical protein
VNLEFDTQADALISEAGRVFGRLAPVARLRAPSERSTWAGLVSAGWHNMGGAIARGELDLGTAAGVFREAGRTLLIEQYVTCAYLLSNLIAGCGEGGDVLAARLESRPGVLLGDGRRAELETTSPASGVCFGVEEPFDAYRLTRTENGSLSLGVAVAGEPHVAPIGNLSFGVASVVIDGAWRDVELAIDGDALAQIERETMLVHTAALIGCAEQLVAMTVEHVQGRVQFDVPIASFQSVKHALADVTTDLTIAWSALLCAVADGGTDAHRASVGRYLASEAALGAARAAAQFHGGMGFTWDCDVHFFLKAILDATQRFGPPEAHAERIGRSFREAAC